MCSFEFLLSVVNVLVPFNCTNVSGNSINIFVDFTSGLFNVHWVMVVFVIMFWYFPNIKLLIISCVSIYFCYPKGTIFTNRVLLYFWSWFHMASSRQYHSCILYIQCNFNPLVYQWVVFKFLYIGHCMFLYMGHRSDMVWSCGRVVCEKAWRYVKVVWR